MLQVYDRVLTSKSQETLVALTILVIGLFAYMGVLELLRSRILSRTGRLVDEEIGKDVFDTVINHSLRKTPNINSQPLRDLDTLRQFLSGPGPSALFDAPWAPVYLAFIFVFMHAWLGIFATCGAVLLFIFAILNELLTRNRLEEASRSNMSAHVFAEENRRNAEVIQAMGMIGSMRARWEKLRGTALSDQDRAGDRASFISSATKSIRLLLQSLMLALGAYLAIKNEISPGVMIAASIIMSRALAPVEQSIAHWRGFQSFRRSHKRLLMILADMAQKEDNMQLPDPVGRLHIENIIVPVAGSNVPLLKGLNFKLEPGQALGVIGPTGAGKSTLARALVGVWPIAKGAVRIDGAPIDQWDREQIGKFMGYLPQDVELFAGTIEENICRFSTEPNPEAVVKAARLANVHEMILNLPDGYNTRIGEGGATLSAGQRQRVGLARALYGEPVFIVLDEPNANLDMEGEVALVQAIQAAKANGAAVIVIAHRPSAIQSVDLILFLRDGTQAAFGPRDEVLKQIMKPPQQSGGQQQQAGDGKMPPMSKLTPQKSGDSETPGSN